jgi:hypothetical protein
VIRLLDWNMAGGHFWDDRRQFNADVTLLQEARQPPPGSVEEVVPEDPASRTDGYYQREWRTSVVRLSDQVRENFDRRGYADASACRILSELSWLLGTGCTHRLVGSPGGSVSYGHTWWAKQQSFGGWTS